MNGNFRLIANIIDGLTLTAQAGVNYKNKNNEDIAKAIPLYTWDNNITYYTGAGSPEQSAVDRTTEETVYQNYTAYLNYDKNFGPDPPSGRHVRYGLRDGGSPHVHGTP